MTGQLGRLEKVRQEALVEPSSLEGFRRWEDNHAGGMRVIMEVHTISLLYFKQADTTKQPTAIQTVAMQPMWCNPNINTYLFNSIGLHEGWKKFMQLEYGNECRCAPSHSFIFKQAVTTKQPASIQVVRNCANTTHVEQPKYQHCLSNTTGLHQGWKKVMQLEYGNWCRFAPSHCYTLSLQCHTSSRQLQPNNLTAYKLRQWNPCGATQTSARICSIPLVCTKVGRKTCN